MPLTKEGQVLLSYQQRNSEKEFLGRYGADKLQEKLDREGVYVYGFSNEEMRNMAVDILFTLADECRWGDDEELKAIHANRLELEDCFRFYFFDSKVLTENEILVVEKPFPKNQFDERLHTARLNFIELAVYRLGELTEKQILGLVGGILWESNNYIDIDGVLNKV